MAVVRESCGEGRTIVEGEFGLALGQLELLVEGVDLLPESQDVLLLRREVRLVGHCIKNVISANPLWIRSCCPSDHPARRPRLLC